MTVPVPIRSVGAGAVLHVWLQSPYMLRPASARAGVLQLGPTTPRTSRGWYRADFFAIVQSNDGTVDELVLRVPDLRTVGDSLRSLRCDELQLNYRYVKAAQMFIVPVGMAPETVVLRLNRLVWPGSAAKFQTAGQFRSQPVAI